jgi:hypothetical protein
MSNINALFFVIFSLCFHVFIIVFNLLEMAVVSFSTLIPLTFAGNSAMARLIPPNVEGSSTESDYGVDTIRAGLRAHTEKQHPSHGEQLDGKLDDASQPMHCTVDVQREKRNIFEKYWAQYKDS